MRKLPMIAERKANAEWLQLTATYRRAVKTQALRKEGTGHVITFEEIKDIANDICDALINGGFEDVFREQVIKRDLMPADITAITKLADLYRQSKLGELERDETIDGQKEIYREWERDIH